MKNYAALALLLTGLWGCSNSVLVTVPPKMDLKPYGTLGILEFTSNADPAISHFATQRFQEHVQGAYPGTPILELGTREAVLEAAGGKQLDAEAIRKIGQKNGVSALFVGTILY